MTPEVWRSVDALFQEVADLPAADREALLRGADPEVRGEVEKLLAADGEQGDLVAQAVKEGETIFSAAAPQRFGPWRVLGVLGEGGMGTVYLAFRDDGYFDKQVAIKCVRTGFSTEAAERFRRERNILARLEHPNIARLIDGGETADGQAYLAMEYVQGEDILAFADKHKLDRTARLRLFLQVCAAVQYAHQHLIVHRDIKPANILVTADGTPKLLDFGIARLVDNDLAPTVTQFRAFTPSYASPEQILGEPVMVASDIYSLAVLLYELLTSRRPYQLRTTTAGELERVICQNPPEPPRVSTDLDVIILMAMRKEPERRYRTVQELAGDIESCLAHRTLRARKDTLWYRTTRYLRRNAWGVAATVAILAALAIGMANSEYQRGIAERRFQQVRKLANRFLFDFDREIRQVPGTTKARELVVSTALEYLDSLAREAKDPGLRFELAQAYQKVGDVQGMTGLPNLGRPADALASYRKSIDLARTLHAAKPDDAGYARVLAMALQRISFLQIALGENGQALQSLDEGIRIAEAGIRGRDLQPADLRLMANGYTYLGALQQQFGRAPEALSAAQNGIDWMRRYAQAAPGVRADSDLVRAAGVVGRQQIVAGELVEAATTLREVRRKRQEIAEKAPNDMENLREWATIDHFLANVLGEPIGPNLRQPEEAMKVYEESTELLERLAEADSNNANARLDLANAFGKQADLIRETKPKKSLPMYKRVLKLSADLPGQDSLNATWKMALSLALRAKGDIKAARRDAEEALHLRRQLVGKDRSPEASRLLARNLRALALAAGDLESRALLAEAVELLRPHEALAETNLELAVDISNVWQSAAPFQPELTVKRRNLWKKWAASHPNVYTLWQASRS